MILWFNSYCAFGLGKALRFYTKVFLVWLLSIFGLRRGNQLMILFCFNSY